VFEVIYPNAAFLTLFDPRINVAGQRRRRAAAPQGRLAAGQREWLRGCFGSPSQLFAELRVASGQEKHLVWATRSKRKPRSALSAKY
jgi:hypothetical protein